MIVFANVTHKVSCAFFPGLHLEAITAADGVPKHATLSGHFAVHHGKIHFNKTETLPRKTLSRIYMEVMEA